MKLQKAKRQQAKLRIGLFGPSGSGKTTAALRIAYGLCGDWDKVCVIDTEHRSASLYADMGEFNVIDLEPPFSPEQYIQAIRMAQQAGMAVIIIDSISHEWEGKGGVLEIHEQVSKDRRNGSSYTAWAKVTPRHNAFIDAILSSPVHMICCSRTKDDVTLVKNDQGKDVPQKVGLKAATRAGFDYEMTLCFDLGISHLANASKDRTRLYMDQPDIKLTERIGQDLAVWADSGEPLPPPEDRQAIVDATTADFKALGFTEAEAIKLVLDLYGVKSRAYLGIEQLEDLHQRLTTMKQHAEAS